MSFFCPYTTCPILQNERLQRPFAILRTDDIKKPKTNADRIRSKSDEELAAWLAKQKYRRPTFDGWLPLCNKVMGPRICHEDGCEKCWLDWLKSPVDKEMSE